jgi:hypothetical protein
MLSTQSLHDELDRYVKEQVSLDVLEEWLAAQSWNMHRWAPIGLQNIVASIQARFAEYSDGKIDASAIDRVLREKHEQLQRAAKVETSPDVNLLGELARASPQMRSAAGLKPTTHRGAVTEANSIAVNPTLTIGVFEAEPVR